MSFGYEESSAWISSSESEDSDDGSSTVVAVTPYSKITAYRHPLSIARKTLLPGNRPPHNPRRELAIHKLLKDTPLGESSAISRNVIPLLSYDVYSNGRITLDFPLMQTDLKNIYKTKKTRNCETFGIDKTYITTIFGDIIRIAMDTRYRNNPPRRQSVQYSSFRRFRRTSLPCRFWNIMDRRVSR